MAGRAMALAGARSRHAVLSLTTKFRLPHEGMTDMEYLSRGSAFLLNTIAGSHSTRMGSVVTGSDLVVLTCQHVACPWLFPKYFADKWDWLQHVSEDFVQHSLQLLELPPVQVVSFSGGHHQQQQEFIVPKVLEEIPLQRHVWLHPSRDLAMLSLGESMADIDWEKHAHDATTGDKSPNINKWDLELLSLMDPSRSCTPGDVVLFTGHKQFSFDTETVVNAGDAQDDVGQFPKEVLGRFVGASSQGQAFGWSEEVLEEGMCGGAVVNAEGDCVGLIEGIVPPFVEEQRDPSLEDQQDDPATSMRKALADHVAFIPASEISAFLIEKGPQLSTGMLLGLDDNEDDDALW